MQSERSNLFAKFQFVDKEHWSGWRSDEETWIFEKSIYFLQLKNRWNVFCFSDVCNFWLCWSAECNESFMESPLNLTIQSCLPCKLDKFSIFQWGSLKKFTKGNDFFLWYIDYCSSEFKILSNWTKQLLQGTCIDQTGGKKRIKKL